MKIFKNEIVLKIFCICTLLIALILGCMGKQYATETEKNTQQITKPSVMYNTHIQNDGWEKDFSKKDGEMSGTSGKSLRLEAIKIKLDNLKDVSIKYQTHVQNIGWQDWKSDGQKSGTSGKSLRLEGIKIKLENTEKYSVMYRVHVQNIGWQDWKYDGEFAGTEGKSLRLEAIEIKIIDKVEKGKIAIETTIPETCYNDTKTIKVAGWKMANVKDTKIEATLDDEPITNIKYKERQDVINSVEEYGTIKENPNPGFEFDVDTTALSEGEHNLKIELITKENKVLQTYSKKIKIDRQIHILYQTHVEDIGWQNTKKDGELAGTEGKSLRVEALKINMINLPEGVTLRYQTHVQDIGWQKWKKNNEIAGTSGRSLRVEAIRIKLDGTDEYSIKYRMHVQDIGWQEWCYDGETAGTVGEEKRIEAIEIIIVPKIKESKTEMFIDTPDGQIPNVSQKITGWVMTTVSDINIKILIDNKEIDTKNLKRIERQDVLNSIKGYGNNNETPGFEIDVDFSKYNLGNHSIDIQVVKDNNVIINQIKQIVLRKKIEYGVGIYGKTGLREVWDGRGQDLRYYKYGNGPNIFYATFAIHGFEDIWDRDGYELINIANDFYQRLVNSNDYDIAEKWTIYIFPGINLDGLTVGWTNNGPGRTTLYSQAPGNKGIDLNRCWQIGDSYKKYTDSRNYNGTSGFQAYEAQYLRKFLLNNKSKNGQTVLVDLHGWTQQLIGDNGICAFYNNQFPENDKSSIGRYGTGYLINWARNYLGNSNKVARSALIELPYRGINGHQSVINNNFSNRYIDATLDMLRNM